MRITTEECEALAFCPNSLCEAGHRQQWVPALRETIERTYGDMNSSSSDPIDVAYRNIVENSRVRYLFANEADSVCACGLHKQISDQIRPVYPDAASEIKRAVAASREAAQAGPLPREDKPKASRAPAKEPAA